MYGRPWDCGQLSKPRREVIMSVFCDERGTGGKLKDRGWERVSCRGG